MSEQEFLGLVTAGQPPAPQYFVYDLILNRRQRERFDESEALATLDAEAVRAELARGARVLDARGPMLFAAGDLRGAVKVPADGRFAEAAASPVVSTAPGAAPAS